MNQLIVVFLSGAVLLGLVAWGQRPEHHVPTWLYLLAAAPLAWVQIFGSDRKNEGSVQKGLAILYLFGASIFLMVIGFVEWVMRGTWGGGNYGACASIWCGHICTCVNSRFFSPIESLN